jgi:hypothetical protein
VGIKDVPGGDVEVDPLTWDAVLSGLAGRIAAQVPPAVIDARCAPGQSSQTFHLTVERCFFSQTGTLAYDPTYTGSGADRTGGNCVDIATGFGHTMTIRQNNFFRSAIAIEGNDATVTPNQGTQNVLIQGNFFEPYRRVAHITDPGSGWSIRDNSVEPRFDGTAGFVRLIKNTAKGLRGVVIENNWCGDIVAPAGNTGTQIEIAGGPFVIRDNLLGMSSANLAIKAVGALTAPVIISGNRIVSYGAAPWLDWGTGLGHTTVEAWVTGNDVPEYVEGVAGTPPTMSFGYTTTSLGHTLQAPGVVLGNSKFLQFKPASAANPSLAQIYAGPDDALTALSLPDASIRFRLMGTSSTPAAGQGFEVYSWDGTGFVRPEPMDFLSSLPWSGISGGAVGVAVLLAIIRGDFIPAATMTRWSPCTRPPARSRGPEQTRPRTHSKRSKPGSAPPWRRSF